MLTSLVILRHALAGRRRRWEGADAARPLDATGLAQAQAIVVPLGPIPIGQVLTSPAVRCCHTVAPLAASRRLPVEPVGWLAADADDDAREAGIDGLSGQVLVCTHGECVGPLVEVVARRHRLDDHPTSLTKGSALWFSLGQDPVRVVEIEVPAVNPADGWGSCHP